MNSRHLIAFVVGFAALALGMAGGAQAQSYVADYRPMLVISNFHADEPGGPQAGLIADKAGNLYGTQANGNGAVFMLSPPPAGAPYKGWKETVLYRFQGGTDGAIPRGTLLIDAAGNLYGTTIAGGISGCFTNGCGTIFKLSPPSAGKTAWTETTLYKFTGGTDGSRPSASLISDAAGNLYGTTPSGTNFGFGTVFELSPPQLDHGAWTLNTIYTSVDLPMQGSLTMDSESRLYGVDDLNAYMFTPPRNGSDSWIVEKISTFNSYYTLNGVIFGKDGNLYGVNNQQLAGNGVGDIFRLVRPSKGTRWNFEILARFTGSNGSKPLGGLITDSSGNLYGTTNRGGHGNGGVVFKLAADGTLSLLHKFNNQRDGANPIGSLLLASSGNIFGTSSGGGPNGIGAVWALKGD